MKNKLFANLIALIALIGMMGAFGCSNGVSTPSAPDLTADRGIEDADTNSILGIYDLVLDPETMTLEAVELKGVDAHYDITPYIAPSCSFFLISYNPAMRVLKFDMTITNPSKLAVFDVRTLMLQLPGGGYKLNNADDYTFLFNLYGTPDPNPFKAFAKTAPDREFLPGLSHTENFDITLPPGFAPPLKIRALVECSYPGNCEEPYVIENQAVSNPINSFTSALISLDTHDHQDNVGDVKVDTTPITGGMTTLSLTTPDHWEANVTNSMGLAPGSYSCLIISDSWLSAPNLYDFIDIVVIPDFPVPDGWNGTDYPVPFGGCSMDLGVIADNGGARDSQILTVNDGAKPCSAIMKNDFHYAGAPAVYAEVFNSDPTNDKYKPYPVARLDAADDGAFSFTNDNWDDLFIEPSWIYNSMVWTCYDNVPSLHFGPVPNESRYWFDTLSNYDTQMRPADVCDDFELGQYALFTSTVTYSPSDLLFIGTMPDTYTHEKVMFFAGLEGWEGIGDGLVNPEGILGIDVRTATMDLDTAFLYILEQSGPQPQVEVFYIMDTMPGMGFDMIGYMMTIDVSYGLYNDPTHVSLAAGKDIELLPVNPDYDLNPTAPTICVLVGWGGGAVPANGEVMLYNAETGAFLERVGTTSAAGMPALEGSTVSYLDTDDGDDWEIHVSHTDAAGNTAVRIFNYI